jgi:hypothetical protein
MRSTGGIPALPEVDRRDFGWHLCQVRRYYSIGRREVPFCTEIQSHRIAPKC